MSYSVKQTRQSGFNLIELMVTVFVISLLSMVAIPRYQNFIVRSKIVSDLAVFNQIKKSLSIDYQITREAPTDNSEAGLGQPKTLAGEYIKKIEVKGVKRKHIKQYDAVLRIVITFDNKKLPNLGKNNKLVYMASDHRGRLIWNCKDLSTIETAFRPSECR